MFAQIIFLNLKTRSRYINQLYSLFCRWLEESSQRIIEAIDEEKKSVTFKVIKGDLMESYKTFNATIQMDIDRENNLVTWTFEYQKLNENVQNPNTLMKYCISVTKDIKAFHLK